MTPSNHMLLVAALLPVCLLCGCGEKSASDPPAQGNTPSSDGVSGVPKLEPPNHPGVQAGSRKKHEWTRQQIEKRHAMLAMADLPAYVEDVRGWGGALASGSSYAKWGFIVPRARIADFKRYISDLGVPGDWMAATSPFKPPAERSPEWMPPNPPTDQLIFLRSVVTVADSEKLGLTFGKGKSMYFQFDNPNLANSTLAILFSEQTGNVLVSETYIRW